MDAPPTSSEWFCEKKFGDGGYRSPYLSHAKRALYHLSYVPMLKPRFQHVQIFQQQTKIGVKFKDIVGDD